MNRVAVLGYSHESNTFAQVPATIDRWKANFQHDDTILEQHSGARTTIAGFLARIAQSTVMEAVPLSWSHVTPMGPIPSDDYEELTAFLLDRLRTEGPWDAVLLPLHGAAVSTTFLDADGEFIRRVRDVVGGSVPIGVTFDMHANISEQMTSIPDIVTAYQTNPHVDAYEQAYLCAELIELVLTRTITPTTAYERIPIAINILRQGTNDYPMKDILHRIDSIRQRPGMLSVTLAEGFPYADVPEMGMSVTVITDNDAALAEQTVAEVRDLVNEYKEDFLGNSYSPDEAFTYAKDRPKPVILLDTGDNVGGGGPGDTTPLLHAAERNNISKLAHMLYDPEAVQQLLKIGVGNRVETEMGLTVGGKTDPASGEPFPISGTIRAVSDGQIDDTGPTHGGVRFYNLGETVYLETDDGLHIVVTSQVVGTVSQLMYRTFGIELEKLDYIVAKGVHSPRAGFGSLNAEFIQVGTPGCTSADLSQLRYRNVVAPIYPVLA